MHMHVYIYIYICIYIYIYMQISTIVSTPQMEHKIKGGFRASHEKTAPKLCRRGFVQLKGQQSL